MQASSINNTESNVKQFNHTAASSIKSTPIFDSPESLFNDFWNTLKDNYAGDFTTMNKDLTKIKSRLSSYVNGSKLTETTKRIYIKQISSCTNLGELLGFMSQEMEGI